MKKWFSNTRNYTHQFDETNGYSFLRILLFSTIFPNFAQPQHGVFVKNRANAISEKAKLVVIAPISITQQYKNLIKIPYRWKVGNILVWHPRFFVFPNIFKGIDGELLFRFTHRYVRQINRFFKPDLIEGSYAYPDAYAAMKHAAVIKKPLVVTLRGSDLYVLAKDPVRRSLITKTLFFANGIIAVSEGLKKIAIEMGAKSDKTVVIPNGVDHDLFRPITSTNLRRKLDIPEDALVILGVGRLVKLKRFDMIIRIVAILEPMIVVPVYCVIVGSGEEFGYLSNLAMKLKVKDRLRLVGRQLPETLPKYYNMADILIVLSTHEGSPNVPLESLSCGTPVIATPVGNLPELINSKNGFILNDSANLNEMCHAIRYIFQNNQIVKTTVRNTVADFTWKKAAEKHIAFMKHILNERN